MFGPNNKLSSASQMIAGLKELMVERLEAFRARLKSLPKRVIVYRDGVSEASIFSLYASRGWLASM